MVRARIVARDETGPSRSASARNGRQRIAAPARAETSTSAATRNARCRACKGRVSPVASPGRTSRHPARTLAEVERPRRPARSCTPALITDVGRATCALGVRARGIEPEPERHGPPRFPRDGARLRVDAPPLATATRRGLWRRPEGRPVAFARHRSQGLAGDCRASSRVSRKRPSSQGRRLDDQIPSTRPRSREAVSGQVADEWTGIDPGCRGLESGAWPGADGVDRRERLRPLNSPNRPKGHSRVPAVTLAEEVDGVHGS